MRIQSSPVGPAHCEDGGAVGWVTHALAVSEAGRIEHDGATRDSLVLMAGSEEDGAVVAAEMSCEGEMAALAAALTKWDMLLTAVWAVFSPHEAILALAAVSAFLQRFCRTLLTLYRTRTTMST